MAWITTDWSSSHHTVRCAHKSGDVISFIIVACRISSRLKWYKNCKNRLRLAKVIVKNKMSRFFMVQCVYFFFTHATIIWWIRCICTCIWNSLPAALRTATLSPLTFARHLKRHLFDWLTAPLRTIKDALYKSAHHHHHHHHHRNQSVWICSAAAYIHTRSVQKVRSLTALSRDTRCVGLRTFWTPFVNLDS